MLEIDLFSFAVGRELVGGLDIIKEMRESGDLKNALGIQLVEEVAQETPTSLLEERLRALISRSRVMAFIKGIHSTRILLSILSR